MNPIDAMRCFLPNIAPILDEYAKERDLAINGTNATKKTRGGEPLVRMVKRVSSEKAA